MIEISSKNNINYKNIIKLKNESKYRDENSLFYVEGERIIKDTPTELIESIYIAKSKVEKFNYLIKDFNSNSVYIVDDNLFEKIKDTQNSQGIACTVKYNNLKSLKDFNISNLKSCLILENVSDPGNLGTIIRMSEAMNISLIILCNNCCNLYNTKVIRSCMSSVFRINILISDDITNDINILKNSGFTIYSTVLNDNAISIKDIHFHNKSAFLLGNEANGLSKELIDLSDGKLFIPMCGDIESLNVAVAATIICYENMRQNNYYEA